MARLIRLDGEGESIPLLQDRLTLGTGDEDDVRLASGAFAVEREPGGFRLRTLEGDDGGGRLLKDGERLALGEDALLFVDDPRCPLTHLPGGGAVDAALAAILARGGSASLLCVEVDRYALLREVQGQAAVDQVVRSVAESLLEGLPGAAVLARERGGAFSVALERKDPGKLAQRLVELVRGGQVESEQAGEPLEVSVSIGVAAQETDLVRLRHAAEAALRRAQRRGGDAVLADGSGREQARPGDLAAGFVLSPDGLGLLGLVEQVLTSTQELEPLMELLLGLVVDRTKAERGILFLAAPDGELTVAAVRSPSTPAMLGLPAMHISRSLVRESARKRQAILVADALSDGRFRDRESVVRSRLRSVLLVPLVVGKRSIGVLYLDNNSVTQRFTPVDQNLLAAFARLVAGPLHRTAQLERERAKLTDLAPARERRPVRGAEGLVGESDALLRVLAQVERFAQSDMPLVIRGESGTGKELLARAVHESSNRRDGPFVSESCSSIPETLMEAALFGYERGAFSGAEKAQAGLFERADGGTLFLDAVDEMPPAMQADLLRVLQEGEVRRLGATKTRNVKLRVIVTTRRPLQELVQAGSFREDLFYRLNVLGLALPPLRDRLEDVPLLVRHFVAKHGGEASALDLAPATLRLLSTHTWPGNVRQLENEIKRLAAVHGQGPVEPTDLSPGLREGGGGGTVGVGSLLGEGGTLKDAVEALERKVIAEVLEKTRGNRSRTARMLGLSRSGLILKLNRYGLG